MANKFNARLKQLETSAAVNQASQRMEQIVEKMFYDTIADYFAGDSFVPEGHDRADCIYPTFVTTSPGGNEDDIEFEKLLASFLGGPKRPSTEED